MNTASTELECFQELQKQEHLAASYRVLNLTEEVNKQKALEQTLQCRYSDLLSGFRRIQGQLEEHNRQLKIQEEIQQQQQQHSLFSQATWGRLEMKPERNKFKVQAH